LGVFYDGRAWVFTGRISTKGHERSRARQVGSAHLPKGDFFRASGAAAMATLRRASREGRPAFSSQREPWLYTAKTFRACQAESARGVRARLVLAKKSPHTEPERHERRKKKTERKKKEAAKKKRKKKKERKKQAPQFGCCAEGRSRTVGIGAGASNAACWFDGRLMRGKSSSALRPALSGVADGRWREKEAAKQPRGPRGPRISAEGRKRRC